MAIHFEGERGDTRTLTYGELLREVCRAANALTSLGIAAGDRVALYLPMVPGTLIAMLACARIGAIHSVVFGGFSADAVAGRVQVTEAKLLITADGSYRHGKPTPLKPTADLALETCPSVRNVLVVRRTGEEVPLTPGRDLWWHDVVQAQSTGTSRMPSTPSTRCSSCTPPVRRVSRRASCTPPATTSPRPPTPITPSSTSNRRPTSTGAPHTCMRWGDDIPARYELSSLRLLGSVGEPISPEAWMWYREKIGGGRCPIVDTRWQTETGAMMIAPLPGVTATKPRIAVGAV